ncbi:alpha/beta fold hydrolase [Oceanidesulfovibrio indonesiensis]|uniref:alpha/beta fold hydrolase n=1 Tax=Oceanidesulfovibrio indonesiensis TaxID=54767 RepID=UPI001184E25E|nr:alpha/beta fold hydrolase [Oceanidesulfovibrio indonesiensis]
MAASAVRTTALLACLLVLLGGCAARWERSLERAGSFAGARDFQRVTFDAGEYLLTGFHNQGRGGDLVVYIQGDGRPYLTRNRVSPNPTPESPLALMLAMEDPAPNVLYLARPCQFVGRSDPEAWRECSREDWTLGRFGPRMIHAMNVALDLARNRFSAERLHLVGHSGGGAMAALLAALRTDVASLITVAATLDHAAWTAHHYVTALRFSANPVDVAPALRDTPQVHFRGGRDEQVPPQTTEAFFHALGRATCLEIVDSPDLAHGRDWVPRWRDMLQLRSTLNCFPDPARK